MFTFYLNKDPETQRSFEEIARMTGGEAQYLNLKAGASEALIHAVAETALEDIGGAAMLDKYRAQYRT